MIEPAYSSPGISKGGFLMSKTWQAFALDISYVAASTGPLNIQSVLDRHLPALIDSVRAMLASAE